MNLRLSICILMLVIEGCTKEASPDTLRQKELNGILKPFLKPGVQTEDYQEGYGWCQPTNRLAMKNFIAKYPDTEEAYQAEIWLIFAQANDFIRDWHQRIRVRAEQAQKLATIISKSTRPGTVKMARLVRVNELCDAENFAESEKAINEILVNIEEYKSENGDQFRRYLKAIDESPSDIEPGLRNMLVIEESYQMHLPKALVLAEDLKQRFPIWDQQSVNGAIEMLKLGKLSYLYFR